MQTIEARIMRRRWPLAIAGAVAFAVVVLSGASAPAAATSPPASLQTLLAPGAKVTLFAGGLEYSEGPLWLPDGRLLVSDVYSNDVLAFDAAGKKSVFRKPSNAANGHALDAHGAVIEAEAGKDHRGAIARIAADGKATVLADNYRGKPFLEPNDVIVKRDGTIWFTDPDFNLSSPPGKATHGVYRLDPKTRVVTRLTTALGAPNGIAFSPDQKTLYVSDSAGDGLVSFPVTPRNTLGPMRHLELTGCDGIGVDARGNVWITTCGNTVVVIDGKGKKVGEFEIPGTGTNVGWGGAHGKTLFITTQEGRIYRLALTVRETH